MTIYPLQKFVINSGEPVLLYILYKTELTNIFSDQELKNIIDKLAQFVARNGPEFEQMTKSKQKDNPKFSFLFGGEFFNYYQFKVTTEQASKCPLPSGM